MENKYQVLKTILVFLPEIAICVFILINPELLKVFLLFVAEHFFFLCYICLNAPQFLLSIALFFFCLCSHLMRFLFLHLINIHLLKEHKPTKKQFFISLLGFGTYFILLINSLSSDFTVDKVSINLIDVIGVSVVSLAFIEILLFIFKTKEN